VQTADPAYLRDSNDCQELFKAFQPMLPSDIEELDLIGSGAFSNVYRVNHRPTGRVYAVKRMSIPAQDLQKKQLVNEVNALAQLRHPNIVPLISGFYHAKQLNIVMELIDGGSLCDYLKICPVIPEPVLGRIAWFCLQGLYYLRQNHYLHRDLKPANILISKIGTVQLADFGMARQLQNSIDTAYSFCGTFCYMAPEKATGQNYSFASDVWSLGLIVYEAALGRFPILSGQTGAREWEMFAALDSDIKVDLAPPFSRELINFIESCLRKDPKARPSTDRLVQHPWVVRYKDDAAQVPLLQWITQVEERRARLAQEVIDSKSEFFA
jgi:serine/threonine protein kinase